MKRQNKHFATIVCLILGAALLCSAAVANIGNAGGYEAYKKGLLGLLAIDRYSGSGYISVEVDGVEFLRGSYTEAYNSEAKPGEAVTCHSLSLSSDYLTIPANSVLEESWYVVNPPTHITGKQYTSYFYNEQLDMWCLDSTSNVGALFKNADEAFDVTNAHTTKVMRVAELALDAFVGDLKNNFVYIGREDGLRSYRISLSGDQLPEIVRALISLLFDGENGSILYGTGSSVIKAVDFDEYFADDYEFSVEYQNAHERAWDIIMNEHDHTGCAVINGDLSIDWYEDIRDYYGALDSASLYDMLAHEDFARLYYSLKGEPEVIDCSCDLSIDESGSLMRNTLSGTVGFELTDDSRHELRLVIHGAFDERGSDVTVPLPDVNPNAACILDQSLACEKNDYEYTVSQNGLVETFHHTVVLSSPDTEWDAFLAMSAFDKLNTASPFTASIQPASVRPTGEYFELDSDGRWVAAEDLNVMFQAVLGDAEIMRTLASEYYGVSPELLKGILLDAYEDLTGSRYEDTDLPLANVHAN